MQYLKRYLAGECESVWEDLTSIGATVRTDPIYSDAVAVGRETMRRVRYNLELLIQRLNQLGYQFGKGFTSGLDSRSAEELKQQAPIFVSPAENAESQLSELEGLAGPLPISLRAFYELVGAVNLVGDLPSWSSLRPKGMEDIPTFVREHPDFDWSSYSLDHGLDPLFVWPINTVLLMYNELKSMADAIGEPMTPYELNIAPDYISKYGKGGSGPYIVEIPCLAADANLRGEWHNTTFVNYLRLSFRWGGMLGLERSSPIPTEDIAFLTEGLLPI